MSWAALLGSLLFVAACRREIGDACKNSVECSYDTDRLCDISQPGGYCTVEGCDERTCPDSSVCIRFFPRQFLTKACTEGCSLDELCLSGDGRCAPRASERRYCAASCEDNSDCRGGYECRQAGTLGTVPLHASAPVVRFCSPVDR